MKKSTKKIIPLSILAVLVVAFFALNTPTNYGGSTRYEPVLSGSMEPAIPVGSLVLIKPVNTESLRVGDVICYRFSDEILITHRIIEITSNGIITKGDANDEQDLKLVQSNNIVGSVVLTIPFVGFLGSLIQSPLGLLFLLFIPGVIFILLEIKGIYAELKKPKTPEISAQ